MLVQQQTVGTSTAAQVTYAYDRADRVTMITYPSGRQVQYNRDAKGRVQSVRTRATSAVATWTDLATAMTYEPFGAVTSLTLGNGLRATNDWGNDGRLASRRLQRISTSANLSLLTYAYDNDDNITGITDGIAATQNQTYAYDAAGRVNRIDSGSGTYKRTDYTYDANGNRLTEQRRTLPTDAAAAQTDTYTIATTSNRLAKVTVPAGSRTITYNAAGNTSSETRPASVTVSTTYDGYGRLTGYTRTGTSALTFAYNGRDDRVSMTSSTGTRRFVYAPDGRVMGEYGASAADVKAEFIWMLPEASNDNMFGGSDGVGGYAPLAVATPSGTGTIVLNWVHGNHLGVPLVTTDAGGNAATTPNDYLAPGFPGQSKVLADVYYNRYRDYDPALGRYIQADPIGLDGGKNLYSYVRGSPVNRIDPMGLRPLSAKERLFLAEYFGDCLDPDYLSVNPRIIGDTSRAISTPFGGVNLPTSYFIGGDASKDVRLDDAEAAGVFAHEILHQWQRNKGVMVTGPALDLQILYSLGIYNPYSFVPSNDPSTMLEMFKNSNVERQGNMFEQFVRRKVGGSFFGNYISIGSYVKKCGCEK